MSDLVTLEREMAGVLTLGELGGSVLDRVKEIAGASDAMVFAFDASGLPTASTGELAHAMRGYTRDLFQEDLLQAYSRAQPKESFFIGDCGDFDLRGHLRSRPYADFYRPNGIGCVYALWPTGLDYGAPGMFGVFLCTPSWNDRPTAEVLDRLGRLEGSMRATARRMARFSRLETERDVLRHLVGLDHRALVIWDQEGRLVWASPDATTFIAARSAQAELQRLAVAAARQLRGRPDSRPSLFARPARIEPYRGRSFLAEFCLIPAADRRPWLLAELSGCDGAQALLATLTAAERRVLALVARGLTNREIGTSLFVSTETVRTHVGRILRKLDVDTRWKAARLAHDGWRLKNHPFG